MPIENSAAIIRSINSSKKTISLLKAQKAHAPFVLDDEGNTLLHCCAMQSNKDPANFMRYEHFVADFYADWTERSWLKQANVKGYTPLHLLAQHGHLATIKKLITPQQRTIDPLACVQNGRDDADNMLTLAIKNGQVAILEYLLPLVQLSEPEVIKLYKACNNAEIDAETRSDCTQYLLKNIGYPEQLTGLLVPYHLEFIKEVNKCEFTDKQKCLELTGHYAIQSRDTVLLDAVISAFTSNMAPELTEQFSHAAAIQHKATIIAHLDSQHWETLGYDWQKLISRTTKDNMPSLNVLLYMADQITPKTFVELIDMSQSGPKLDDDAPAWLAIIREGVEQLVREQSNNRLVAFMPTAVESLGVVECAQLLMIRMRNEPMLLKSLLDCMPEIADDELAELFQLLIKEKASLAVFTALHERFKDRLYDVLGQNPFVFAQEAGATELLKQMAGHLRLNLEGSETQEGILVELGCALHRAIHASEATAESRLVKLYLAWGADLSVLNENQQTPYMHALAAKRPDIADQCLKLLVALDEGGQSEVSAQTLHTMIEHVIRHVTDLDMAARDIRSLFSSVSPEIRQQCLAMTNESHETLLQYLYTQQCPQLFNAVLEAVDPVVFRSAGQSEAPDLMSTASNWIVWAVHQALPASALGPRASDWDICHNQFNRKISQVLETDNLAAFESVLAAGYKLDHNSQAAIVKTAGPSVFMHLLDLGFVSVDQPIQYNREQINLVDFLITVRPSFTLDATCEHPNLNALIRWYAKNAGIEQAIGPCLQKTIPATLRACFDGLLNVNLDTNDEACELFKLLLQINKKIPANQRLRRLELYGSAFKSGAGVASLKILEESKPKLPELLEGKSAVRSSAMQAYQDRRLPQCVHMMHYLPRESFNALMEQLVEERQGPYIARYLESQFNIEVDYKESEDLVSSWDSFMTQYVRAMIDDLYTDDKTAYHTLFTLNTKLTETIMEAHGVELLATTIGLDQMPEFLMLLSHKLSIEKVATPDATGATIWHLAVNTGNSQYLESLLGKEEFVSSSINVADTQGRTPLNYALSFAEPKVEYAKSLLEQGALFDKNTIDRVFEIGDDALVQALMTQINAMKDDKPCYQENMADAISYAMRYHYDDQQVFDWLNLPNMPKVFKQYSDKTHQEASFSPLSLAAHYGRYQIVAKILQKANYDIALGELDTIEEGFDYQDYFSTKMIEAANAQNVDNVKLMIKAGARVNTTDSNGYGLLHIAVNNGDANLLNYVMRLPNYNIEMRDRCGDTAVHIARSINYQNPQFYDNYSRLETKGYHRQPNFYGFTADQLIDHKNQRRQATLRSAEPSDVGKAHRLLMGVSLVTLGLFWVGTAILYGIKRLINALSDKPISPDVEGPHDASELNALTLFQESCLGLHFTEEYCAQQMPNEEFRQSMGIFPVGKPVLKRS